MSDQQQADTVEHTLAGEEQCACCEEWRQPHDLIRPVSIRYFGRPVCRSEISQKCDWLWKRQTMAGNSAP